MNIRLKNIIIKKAKKLAENEIKKIKKDCENKILAANNRADAAEKKTEQDELYFQARDDRRENVYIKKLEYVNRLKSKTVNECNKMIENTKSECETRLAKARGFVSSTKHLDDENQKKAKLIDEKYKNILENHTWVKHYADQSHHNAVLADELMRKMGH